MQDDRLFAINGGGDPCETDQYWTGRASDGRQALFGWGREGFVALWFDAEGALLGSETVSVSRELDTENEYGTYRAIVFQHLVEYQERAGWSPEVIRVRQFALHEPFLIAIRLMDDWMTEFLCDPYADQGDAEAQGIMLEAIARWQARDTFELRWGQENFFIVQGPRDAAPAADCLDRLIGWPAGPSSAGKLYRLRTAGADGGEADFYTGTAAGGQQLLMGQYRNALLCARFDGEGCLAGVEARPLPAPAPSAPAKGRGRKRALAQEAEEAERRRAQALGLALAWQAELGWQAGPICVRKFLLEKYHVYVSDYPNWAIILHHDPYFYVDLGERARLREQMAAWEQAGKFVFWWGKDYFMSKDGEVLST